MFVFVVSWQKACTCDLSELSTAVNGTTFNIQNLEPDTNYRICVSAVSTSDNQVKSERKCLHTKTLTSKTYHSFNDIGLWLVYRNILVLSTICIDTSMLFHV